jgi:hypothetical protein
MHGQPGLDAIDHGTAPRERGPRRMPTRRWRKPLLVVHVTAAVGLVGADLALLALAVAGATGTAASEVYPAMGLVDREDVG